MKTIILKDNSSEIRDKIEKAHITLCFCSKLVQSAWLVYYAHRFDYDDWVHGVGYTEFEDLTQIQVLNYFMATANNPYVCKDVDEFINTIKEIENEQKD